MTLEDMCKLTEKHDYSCMIEGRINCHFQMDVSVVVRFDEERFRRRPCDIVCHFLRNENPSKDTQSDVSTKEKRLS